MAIDNGMITGLILAGGRATRMGGVDKGLQLLNGEPMVAHILRRLRPQVGALLINANRNADAYRQFGCPVTADELPGYAGPLAGLQAGLGQCQTPYMLTAACDSPLIPGDLAARLADAIERERSDVAVVTTGIAPDRQRQPVFMLVKSSLRPQLTAWLQAGGRKVDDWLQSVPCAEAAFDDEAAFDNINTADQLERLARRVR